MIIRRSISRNNKGRSLFVLMGRSLFYFRRSVIRNNKGRSVLMRGGRSQLVESSYCLVFGVKGDRLHPDSGDVKIQDSNSND